LRRSSCRDRCGRHRAYDFGYTRVRS
jgi:hypothetical protein